MLVIIIITYAIHLTDFYYNCQYSYNFTILSFFIMIHLFVWEYLLVILPGWNFCTTSHELCILYSIFLLPLHKIGNMSQCGIFSHNIVIVFPPL